MWAKKGPSNTLGPSLFHNIRILNHYENALAACLVLNAYIPMLSGTGG